MPIIEEHLPIIEVSGQNITDVFPQLRRSLMESSFIAIDTEMSGLGDRKNLFCPEIDMRYKYVAELARTHGTLSMGFSCYKCTSSDDRGQHYTVSTYDVMVLPNTGFSVETESLKFLQNNGFNFNSLVQHGLPYTPGNDPPDTQAASDESSNSSSCSDGSASPVNASEKYTARSIFGCLVAASKPIVLHNGFVDLLFLYQHFYAELPKRLDTFASNINQMFPLGIYDTKYFSEFVNRAPASYLQFVYVKELLHNDRRQQQQGSVGPHVKVSFPSQVAPQTGLMYYRHLCALHEDPPQGDNSRICECYSYHGWCKVGETCPYSHNVLRIVKELCDPHIKTKGVSSKGKSGRRGNLSRAQSTGTNAMLQSALRHNALHTNTAVQASKRTKVEDEGKSKEYNSKEDNVLCNDIEENNVGRGISEVENQQRLLARRGRDDGVGHGGASNQGVNQKAILPFNSTRETEQNINGVHTEKDLISSYSLSNGHQSIDTVKTIFDSTNSKECNTSNGELFQSVHSSNGILSKPMNGSSKITNYLEEPNESLIINGTSQHSHEVTTSYPNDSDGLGKYACIKGLKRELPSTNDSSQRNNSNTSTSKGHCSGFDAFMTGYVFASFICQNAKVELNLESGDFLPSAIGCKELVNKVYLMRKNFPFLVKTTPFAKPSNNHSRKIKNLHKLYSTAHCNAPTLNGTTPCSATNGLC